MLSSRLLFALPSLGLRAFSAPARTRFASPAVFASFSARPSLWARSFAAVAQAPKALTGVQTKAQKEKEREQKRKAQEKDKARIAKEKEVEKERKVKEVEKVKKAKESEKLAASKLAEREKAKKAKDTEKTKADKEKEKIRADKEKEKVRVDKEKEKVKAQKEKEKEKAVQEKEKEKALKEKEKGKRKKDPNAPTRPSSAWILYSTDIRPTILKSNPDLKIGDVSKEAAKRYKSLSDAELKPYLDKAAASKAEYQVKSAEYKKSLPQPVKRALSPYIIYSMAIRPQILKERPGLSVTETSKEIGARWKQLTQSEKSKYEQQAQADKDRLQREKASNEAN